MRAVLRWWAERPWGCLVLAVFGSVLGLMAGIPGAGLAASFLVAWVSLVQGLRTLWRRSRIAAGLMAALAVALGLSLLRPDGVAADAVAAASLGLSPFLAWAVDVALGRLRRARGPLWLDLPDDRVSPAPKSARARYRSGCMVVLALGVAYGIYFVIELTAPQRHAGATIAALRPGAEVREILAAARGGFMCLVTDADGRSISETAIGRIHSWSGIRFEVYAGSSASLGPSLSREELLRLLGQRSDELAAARRLHFTFIGGMPLRVSFTVTLDERGRFVSTSPLRAWD